MFSLSQPLVEMYASKTTPPYFAKGVMSIKCFNLRFYGTFILPSGIINPVKRKILGNHLQNKGMDLINFFWKNYLCENTTLILLRTDNQVFQQWIIITDTSFTEQHT